MIKAIFGFLFSLLILFSFFVFGPEIDEAAMWTRGELGIDPEQIDTEPSSPETMEVPFESEHEQVSHERSSKSNIVFHARDVDEILNTTSSDKK